MGKGKETSSGEILGWPFTSMWGGVACMLDAGAHPVSMAHPEMPGAFVC